jgi:hypothetical protein
MRLRCIKTRIKTRSQVAHLNCPKKHIRYPRYNYYAIEDWDTQYCVYSTVYVDHTGDIADACWLPAHERPITRHCRPTTHLLFLAVRKMKTISVRIYIRLFQRHRTREYQYIGRAHDNWSCFPALLI